MARKPTQFSDVPYFSEQVYPIQDGVMQYAVPSKDCQLDMKKPYAERREAHPKCAGRFLSPDGEHVCCWEYFKDDLQAGVFDP